MIKSILSQHQKNVIEEKVKLDWNAREISDLLAKHQGRPVEDKSFKAIKNRIMNIKRKLREANEEVEYESEQVEEVKEEEVEEIACYEMASDILLADYLDDAQKVKMLIGFFGLEEE